MHPHVGLKEIEEKVSTLPFLPAVLTEILQLKQEDDDYFEKVVELARKDPSISALILKLANSAAVSSAGKIDTLQRAVSRIGTHSIASYVAALGVTRVFVPSDEEHKLLWKHSIETAIIVEYLATHMEDLKVDPNVAYLCGLMHDIGRFVMFDTAPDALTDTPSKSWASPEELPKIEKKTIGYDHTQVGLIACKHWHLPTLVCNIVRGHHMYSIYSEENLPIEFRNLMLLIQISDFISVYLAKHPDWPSMKEAELEKAIRGSCIHENWKDVTFPIRLLVINLDKLLAQANSMAESIGCN